MATTLSVFSLFFILGSLFLLPPGPCHAHPLKSRMFDAIYQPGDSISDTGNLIRESPFGGASANACLPYGDTFFKNATGRCSNGLLMVDYLDCAKKLKTALFVVGEIGGNDYDFALFQRKTIEEVKRIVPDVVYAIKGAVKRVIDYGAACVVVLGYFPIGCLPMFLAGFQINDSAAYDKLHRLKGLNDVAMYHNVHLQNAVKQKNPNEIIVYADYYNAFIIWLLQNAPFLGFDEHSLRKACCGIGGDYDFTLAKMCGAPGVPVCSDPQRHLSWGGIHLTQNAYKFMSGWLVHDLFPKLQCIG